MSVQTATKYNFRRGKLLDQIFEFFIFFNLSWKGAVRSVLTALHVECWGSC